MSSKITVIMQLYIIIIIIIKIIIIIIIIIIMICNLVANCDVNCLQNYIKRVQFHSLKHLSSIIYENTKHSNNVE